MDDMAIRVENVSKVFKLPHEKNSSIKSAVVNFYRPHKKSYELQKALDGVSFDIKKGEFFGIVGRNGSGKSTLLKMLAGIYSPTQGSITVNGTLTPFIELGVGFNMELTGRENVYLNGALLGFSRSDMNAMYKDIVEFAELEKFMDQKLKNYSSGMQVRLAFSIAIRARSDILLIDEVLAVGDASFQQKCYSFFSELKRNGHTVVLVTHDMSAVLRFCDRAILINDGRYVDSNTPKIIAEAYLALNYEIKETTRPHENDGEQYKYIEKISINNNVRDRQTFKSGQEINIKLEYKNISNSQIHFGLQIFNEAGNYCFGSNTGADGLHPSIKQNGSIHIKIRLDLVPGPYTITTAIMNDSATEILEYSPNSISFRIARDSEVEGVANLKHHWEVSNV